MKAKFHHSENITHDIVSFWFEPEKKFDYQPGQYSDITFHNFLRTYTLSSSPTEPLIAITTKFREPSSEFKSSLRKIKKGEEIIIKEPMGDYVLPKDPSIPLIFISGGIGITPARSIVKYLVDSNETRNIQLLYAVKSEDDLAFDKLFKNSKFVKYIPVVSRQSQKTSHETGKLTTDRVKSLATFTGQTMVYVSGPQEMVETICDELSRSMNRNQIIMDYFDGYVDI